MTEGRALAHGADAVALIKGTRTVIARPDGRVRVNPTGSTALATAGTGDVLTGTIGGFLARGAEPFDAAWAGAFVHGLAGILAAETLGRRSGRGRRRRTAPRCHREGDRMTRFRPTWVEVDRAAIAHNVAALRPETAELMAVVKGDAYGHGAVTVARAAIDAGATWCGVALVEEGLELRDAGVEAPILVLSELPPGSEAVALAHRLTPTLYSATGLARLAAAARGPVGVHVKVDTGMHRVGVWPPEALVPFLRTVAETGLEVEGIWTHLAKSEDDAVTTAAQLGPIRGRARRGQGGGVRAPVPPRGEQRRRAATPRGRLRPRAARHRVVRDRPRSRGGCERARTRAHLALRASRSRAAWRRASG